MTETAARDARYDLVAEDIQLHRTLCELSGNQRLVRAFDDMTVDLTILISRLADMDTDPRIVTESHHPFVDALMARDAQRAADSLAGHIDEAWRELRERVDLLAPEAGPGRTARGV